MIYSFVWSISSMLLSCINLIPLTFFVCARTVNYILCGMLCETKCCQEPFQGLNLKGNLYTHHSIWTAFGICWGGKKKERSMSAARDKLAEFMFILIRTFVLVMNCVFFSLGAPNIPWMVNIFNVIIWFDVHRKFISKLASYDDR